MKATEFCYWLQGFFELQSADTSITLSSVQVAKIKHHLALVFTHDIDPAEDGGDPAKKALLDAIHAGDYSSKPSRPRC